MALMVSITSCRETKEEAEKAGDQVEAAAEKAGDALDDAADATEDAVIYAGFNDHYSQEEIDEKLDTRDIIAMMNTNPTTSSNADLNAVFLPHWFQPTDKDVICGW